MTPLARALLHCALVWHASQYSPGTMERVHIYRGLPPLETDGRIAAYDCDAIGQVWWLRPIGQDRWESFQVTDCAHPLDGAQEWMKQYRIIAEVDYPTAVRWGTVGRGIHVQIKGTVRAPTLER